MRRALKWLGGFVGVIALLAVCAGTYVWIASSRALQRSYDEPLASFVAPNDPAAVAEGHRQAIILGCTGCHGANLQGHELIDDAKIGRIRAPNLTTLLDTYSDAELERLLRRGVKRDGVGLWIMPNFSHLTDEDLGALIAYLRTVPERPGEPGEIALGPMLRVAVTLGQVGPSVHQGPREPTTLDRSDAIAFGRYMIKSGCTDCHGANLQGSEWVHSPSLMVSAGYGDEDFTRLMRTGIAVGNRELGKMTQMGRERFPSLTDEEIHAIRTYLREFVRRGGTSMP